MYQGHHLRKPAKKNHSARIQALVISILAEVIIRITHSFAEKCVLVVISNFTK